MFGNPYFNGYREPNNTQPINNIFTTQMPQNDLFMARFLRNGEMAENQLVTSKTAFIDLEHKQLKIKDTTGDITTYGLILPLDEKDMKINSLEQEIRELKEMLNNESNAIISTDYEVIQSNGNGSKHNRRKSADE